MVVYVGSMTDEVFEETALYKEILEIVPWPLLTDKSSLASDRLLLRAQSHLASQIAAFADCWLRFAPTSRRITMSDIAAIRFEHASFMETAGDAIFKHVYPSWAVNELLIHRIVENEYDDILIDEHCYARGEVFGWKSDCYRTIQDEKKNSSVETILLRKSRLLPTATNYQNDIERCLQYKPSQVEKSSVMKLEFDLEKKRQDLDPCELRLRRESMRCRVAVKYSSVMFRERMKISLVKKRGLLSFSHGCHL
ncbi:unnamed protein product [Angiostrongylus costaricensis]|uniref:Glycosyltransferase family 92 protein n=1 Tax=Angiostrongylus costaricensis TaxID=334426 RepID=A0A0R3PJ33_ANGCS|nr:unnamed protein product [Angiostrongylus costaricensis]